jgi:hypothetical protein
LVEKSYILINYKLKTLKTISMKKQILGFALVATMIGSISMGCGSEKSAGSGSDSTATDSTATMATPTTTTPTDTMRKDTMMKDTTKKP